MKNVLFLFVILTSSICFGQVNESPVSAYNWKGKKTELSPGYVILNSGKKMEGQISLRGKVGSLTSIYYEGDGKEIDFPLTAIKAYGLAGVSGGTAQSGFYNGPLVCDNNEELFTWRDMGQQMEKQIHTTKPRNGYVVKRDGTRIEGELQIKKVNHEISQFTVKGSHGKAKLDAAEVGHYGLQMTMAELTKDGEKNYKDEARNFHKGKLQLQNGEEIEGYVAFKKAIPINPNRPGAGDKYTGLFFAKNESSYVKTFTDDELLSITQNIDGTDVIYSPYEGGFVSATTMDDAKYTNKEKQFNAGTLTLMSGEILAGEIAIPNSSKVNYRSDAGLIAAYNASDIKRLVVMVEGEEKHFVQAKDFLVEEFFNGNTFQVFENAFPTTVNEKRTNLARSAFALSTSAASAAIMNQDEKKYEYESNIDSLLMHGSLDDLKKFQAGVWQLAGASSSEDFQNKSTDDRMNKLEAAVALSIAGKEQQDDIVIYYDEIVVINKSTNEKMILYKDKDLMNDKLEGLLMGCYSFLELDKKEQKQYYDIDNVKSIFKMLDECY